VPILALKWHVQLAFAIHWSNKGTEIRWLECRGGKTNGILKFKKCCFLVFNGFYGFMFVRFHI